MMKIVLVILIALSTPVRAEDVHDQVIREEFISLLDLVSQYFQRDLSLLPEVPREKMSSVVTQMRALPSRIQVVEARPVDNRGIEKAAVFYINQNVIKVHRSTWVDASKEEKAIIAALELMGLSGVDKNRYELVMHNVFPFPDDISKLVKVQEDLCKQSANQAVTFNVAYMDAVWECRSLWKGMPKDYAKLMEKRVLQAIDRCHKECAYGRSDMALRDGWCGTKTFLHIRQESIKQNGRRCL